jgi:putative peptidoglycan lipid II flippase
MLFIVGSFLSAILQSYNHFFIPGIASALYNLGIILGIVFLAPFVGIYSAAYGIVFGALIFVLAQVPLVKKMGFSFIPSLSLNWIKTSGVIDIFKLIWPRTISIAIFQIGTLITVTLVSFLQDPGRNYVIFDYAQTLAFAPVALFGQAIAQAAFPVLSKERDRPEDFKTTFITSFNQLLYIALPFSVLFLVLRIPIVRLVFGAAQFDWQATVLTGRTWHFLVFQFLLKPLFILFQEVFMLFMILKHRLLLVQQLLF